MRQLWTAAISRGINKVSIVKPSCTFIRSDSCAQTAVFRIPERFFRCPCYKSYNGGPRGFPPMGGQLAGLNKAWREQIGTQRVRLGPADPVQDPAMTVHSTWSAILTRQPCAVMMINSVHQRFLINQGQAFMGTRICYAVRFEEELFAHYLGRAARTDSSTGRYPSGETCTRAPGYLGHIWVDPLQIQPRICC